VEPSIDARSRVEGAPGLTDSLTVRRRESTAIDWQLFCLPRWINEITRLPRPASLESSSEVETVHPLVGLVSASDATHSTQDPKAPARGDGDAPTLVDDSDPTLRPPAGRPSDLASGVSRCLGLPLVVRLLAACEGDLDLCLAVLEIQRQRDQRQAALLRLADQSRDLTSVQQQLARPTRLVIGP
jgi:hypothetical protein